MTTIDGFNPLGYAGNVVFMLDKPTDAPLALRLVVHAKTNNGVELFNDTYQATIPAGETYVTVPAKLYDMNYVYQKDGIVSQIMFSDSVFEVVEYNGKDTVELGYYNPPPIPLDHL